MNNPSQHEFSEIKHKAIALIHEVSDLLLKCEDAVNAEFDISQQQFLVLMAIESAGTPYVKITDVARKLNRNSNSISMIIDRMERDNLVERVRDLQDRRSVHLFLTEKGKGKLYQTSKVSWGLIVRLMACYSEKEMETLVSLVEKLRKEAYLELNPNKSMDDMNKPDKKMADDMLRK